MVGIQLFDEKSKGIVINGLKRIRIGALIFIIATLLTGVALATLFLSLLTEGDIFVAFTGAVTMIVLALVGVVLSLIALFVFVIPGTSSLASWNTAFSTSSKLLKIGYGVGMMLMFIALAIVVGGALTLNPGVLLGGGVIALIAAIMVFIGYIGLIILSFRLKDVFGETIFLIAGILFIVGIFVSILTFIAWILMFVGLGITISKLEALPPSAMPSYLQTS